MKQIGFEMFYKIAVSEYKRWGKIIKMISHLFLKYSFKKQ